MIDALTHALVAERGDLYLLSPAFHDSIDALVALLPAWVDGLAAVAVEEDRARALLLEVARRSIDAAVTDPGLARLFGIGPEAGS